MMTGQQPNLLFVFADQLRGMDLGCAGNPEVITPNLDRFAAEGTLFRRAFANVPVCTPSRAVLLTGRYPLANRVIGNDLPLPEDMPTLGERFRDSGYRTGYIGKWHLDGVPRAKFTPPGARRHGFEYWAAYNCSHDYFRPHKCYRDDPEPVVIEGYEPEVQTNQALDFIAAQDERPFCLVLSWGPPHDPYPMVPERYKTRYEPQQLTLRPNVQPLRPASEWLARGLEPRRTLADYYAAITALDEQFGRLLDGLAAAGLDENTIVVFTSDHGDQLWSHGTMKKQQPFEESIHIPLICRWPGRIPAGRRSDALVSIVDYAPTLCGLAGITPPEGVQGTDRSALVLGQDAAGADAVLLMDLIVADESRIQELPEWRGLRTSRYTYAQRQNGEDWLLFDNEQDPYQLTNLVDTTVASATRDHLARELDRRLAEIGDHKCPGEEYIRALGLVALWNARQLELRPDEPGLLI
jgi:arylsulfatase A-like enzyme